MVDFPKMGHSKVVCWIGFKFGINSISRTTWVVAIFLSLPLAVHACVLTEIDRNGSDSKFGWRHLHLALNVPNRILYFSRIAHQLVNVPKYGLTRYRCYRL